MAGPALTGVRSVIDPYEGLQKAVSDAGSIYRDFEKSRRETALYNEQMAEFDRANQQRAFLKDYDPQLGVNGRGLSEDTERFVQEEENKLIKKYSDIAARGEVVPPPEAIHQQFRDYRKSLVTQEAAKDIIMADMLRMGMTPEQAEAQAAIRANNFTSRASLLEAEKEKAKLINDTVAARRDAAAKYADLEVKANSSNNAYRGVSQGSGAKGGANDPYSSTGSVDDLVKIREYIKPIVGGWMDFDTGPTMDKLTKGYAAANERLISAGLNPIPIKELGMFADATIENDWYGSNTKFKSPGDVADALLEKYSTPGYQRTLLRQQAQGTGGRSIYSVPDWVRNDMLDMTVATPRTMTAIEKERVQRVFGTYTEPEAPKRQVPARTTSAPAQESKSDTSTGQLTPQQLEAIKKLQGELKVPGTPKPTETQLQQQEQEKQTDQEAQGIADTLYGLDQELARLSIGMRTVTAPDNITNFRQRVNVIGQERERMLGQIQELRKQRAALAGALKTPGMEDTKKLVDDLYKARERQGKEDIASARQAAKDKKAREKDIQEIEKALNNPNLPPVVRIRLENNLKQLSN